MTTIVSPGTMVRYTVKPFALSMVTCDYTDGDALPGVTRGTGNGRREPCMLLRSGLDPAPISIGGTRRYYARLICLKGIHHPSVPRAALLMWSTCVPDLLDGLGFVEGGREGGGGQTAAYLYKITGPSRGPCLSFFLNRSQSLLKDFLRGLLARRFSSMSSIISFSISFFAAVVNFSCFSSIWLSCGTKHPYLLCCPRNNSL